MQAQRTLLYYPDVTSAWFYLAVFELLLAQKIYEETLRPRSRTFFQLDEALRAIIHYLELEPGKPAGYYLLGKIFEIMDHYEKNIAVVEIPDMLKGDDRIPLTLQKFGIHLLGPEVKSTLQRIVMQDENLKRRNWGLSFLSKVPDPTDKASTS